MSRKKATGQGSKRSITNSLRDFIRERDLTDYQLGQLAEVDPGLIGRFMRREREPSGPTLDRLCEALGLHLVEKSRGKGRQVHREGPSNGSLSVGGSGDDLELGRGRGASPPSRVRDGGPEGKPSR
jgi:transcriptional regulator with XRE-family HTH domain